MEGKTTGVLYCILYIGVLSSLSPSSSRVKNRKSKGGGKVQAVLEMVSVTSADAGPYTCRATNPHGSHSQVFDVAIIGKVWDCDFNVLVNEEHHDFITLSQVFE